MLSIGKLLTEEQGRLTVRRVLSVDGGTAKVETTYEDCWVVPRRSLHRPWKSVVVDPP